MALVGYGQHPLLLAVQSFYTYPAGRLVTIGTNGNCNLLVTAKRLHPIHPPSEPAQLKSISRKEAKEK